MKYFNIPSKKDTYWKGFFFVIFIYLIFYIGFLWFTDYIPYVLDNNESFSALVHAYNLYHGDLSKSFGLTDEAFSPFPNAHPMIHTHQGNWPRIFAYILYVLGAKSVESQIVIATFTIGLCSIWLIYHYFSKISTVLFALIVTILMMTDYIFFAQWQVNTYRVWHAFFVFSSLLCVHGLANPARKTWIGLNVLNYTCLFYGELVFAIFVSSWAALYTCFLYFRQLKKLFLGALCQVSGACIGIGVLLLQLKGFMGWENVLKDLSLTFMARNFSADAKAIANLMKTFYDDLNVAFFYNIQNGSVYRNIPTFIKSFFQYGLQIYSAPFSLIVLILWFVWGDGFIASLCNSKRKIQYEKYFQNIGLVMTLISLSMFMLAIYYRVGILESILLLFIVLVSILLWVDIRIFVNRSLAMSLLLVPLFIFLRAVQKFYFYDLYQYGLLISFLLAWILSWIILRVSKIKIDGMQDTLVFKQIMLCDVFLLTVTVLLNAQEFLYEISLKELWLKALLLYSPAFWGIIIVILVCSILSFILSAQERNFFNSNFKKNWTFIIYYLITGFIAYAVIYVLSPGYLFSGYLKRYAPFHTFIISVFIAGAIYTFLSLIQFLAKMIYIYWPIEKRNLFTLINRKSISVPSNPPLLIIFVGIFCVVIIQWFFIQYQYIQLLPPTVFNFVKLLKSIEFQGKGSVTNHYPLPFSFQMNSWSYADVSIASGKFTLNNAGYSYPHNLQYLWYADRKYNLDYLHPELFICFVTQDLNTALQRYQYPDIRLRNCSNYYIVQQALSLQENPFGHKLIQQDSTNNDIWAIVKIGWDFPPYLENLNNISPKKIALSFHKNLKDRFIEAKYKYKQQNGVKEGNSKIQLYKVRKNKYGCTLFAKEIIHTYSTGNFARLNILENLTGDFAVVITPHSLSRVGEKWVSGVIKINGDEMINSSQNCVWQPEEKLRQ